jgi:hypothetical protein
MPGSDRQRGKAGSHGGPSKEDDVLTRQFKTAEQHATATMAGWIGHPAVRGIIERHRDEAETAVAPIARHLVGQKEAAAFCWRLYGLAGIGPDWELRRDAPSWTLTPIEKMLSGSVATWFRHVVQVTLSELKSAGVAVKPTWAGDHAAVGEMLLLQVPWHLPPDELAAAMNPPGPCAITANATSTSLRLETGERAETNLTAIRRSYERYLHGPRRPAPYAGGGKRKGRSTTAKRRKVVAEVLEKFPDATASKIFTTFGDYTRLPGGQAGSSGGYLRQLLKKDSDAAEDVRCPSEETLRQDLRAIRAEKDQKEPR